MTARGGRRIAAGRAWRGVGAALLALALGWLFLSHIRLPRNGAVTVAEPGVSSPSPAAPALLATGDINVNTATAQELTRIAGVGDALAAAIIAEREANGRFAYPEDLLAVKGIGQSTLRKLLPQITLE